MNLYQNDSLTPDRLLVGANDNYVAQGILCAGGQLAPYDRGTVMAKITNVAHPNFGEYVMANSALAPDVGGTADCILGEDVDATGPVHVMAPAYFAGEFNERELTFGGVDTADDHRDTLRDKGIFMRYTTPA